MRQTYAGGFYGQLVSGAVWLAAAAALTWVSPAAGVATLFLGGVLIFPLTTLAVRLSGGRASLPPRHPMNALAMQIAFTVPLGLLVVIAMIDSRTALFFPASMVVVGAHYLPFVFLYGMRLFAVLAGVLVSAGVLLLFGVTVSPLLSPWCTGVLLVLFAGLLRASARAIDRTERKGT
jgi:hypothetical protein